MSIIACAECGQNVSDKASNCPHCGVRVTANSSWGIGRFLIAGGVVVAVVSCIASTGTAPQPAAPKTAEQAKADTDRTARYVCKGFIEKALHDPASADLSQWTQAKVTNPSANTTIFEVFMEVRAKNAFNATRLSTMACRVQKSGDNWTLISLNQLPH